MRTVLTVVLLVSASLSAAAQEGLPSTELMTCAQTTAAISRSGSAVLRTGQHTYDRFVAHTGYCDPAGRIELTPVRTRDNPQCPLFICRPGGRTAGG